MVERVEEQQLGYQRVHRVAYYLSAEEEDTVHHQSAENVQLGNVQLPLFDDIRIEQSAVGQIFIYLFFIYHLFIYLDI